MFTRLNKLIGGNQPQATSGIREMSQYLDSNMPYVLYLIIIYLFFIPLDITTVESLPF